MQKAKHGYGTGKLNPNFFGFFCGLWDKRQKTLKLKIDVNLMVYLKLGLPNDGDVGSRSSVRFWITLVVRRVRHTDLVSDPKTRIQQS